MSYLVVTPLSKLADTAMLHQPRELITLMNEGTVMERPAMIEQNCHYYLAFNDINEPQEGFVAPTENEIFRLLDIAKNWNRQFPLLINCFMGISRSTAAAYIIACALQPQQNEEKLAQILRKKATSATPNKLMIALADTILKRNGQMTNAILTIGRGIDAFEGTPFTLPIDN